MNKFYTIPLLFYFFNGCFAFSEESITTFNEKFTIDFFGKYNMVIFTQQQELGYRTYKPWDIGLGIRYKKLSVQLSIPISFNDNSFDLELNSYFEKMYFELFLKRYQSFYSGEEVGYNDAGLDIMAAGITAGWIYNNQNHSLSSVYNLDRKQNISSGSFLYGFGAFYTSIYSENSDIKHYNERKHLIHFGPMAGYSYTWILPHDMFINIGVNIGTHLGINATQNKIIFIPQIKPKISFGHHNRTWSINTEMGCNSTMILWDKNDSDILVPATMTVTFSKRF